MTKPFEDRLADRKLQEARAAFVNYTQSVAFNMTLSRSMVEMLGLIRDERASTADSGVRTPYTNSHFVPVVRRLEARGLVWHDYIEPMRAPKGHQYFKLTRAGELMAELLVEAGLLAAAPAKKRDRA